MKSVIRVPRRLRILSSRVWRRIFASIAPMKKVISNHVPKSSKGSLIGSKCGNPDLMMPKPSAAPILLCNQCPLGRMISFAY
jgi:hypothetical protein